ncbi:MAG: PD-(D/E)XK nuclease family protein [Candidatus Krumholzibacteria bacterium]|nr:PD-(D/E)XK nuclease family protein [Candidatus Krumholzibacteria bacterium]
MIRRLYTAGDFAALEEALAAEVREASRRDPLPGVCIIAGSNLLCSYLRRSLAHRLGGVADLRALTIADLAGLVEDRAGLPPIAQLPPHAPRVLVDEALQGGVPDGLSGLPGTDGFGDALLGTFTDLAEGGYSPEAAGRAIGGAAPSRAGRVRAVLDLFIRYRELIGRAGGDFHDRLGRAAAAAPAAARGLRLFVYGFYDFNELQWRLLRGASGGADTVFFVPWDGSEPFRFASPLVDLLRREGFEHRPAPAAGAPAPATLISAPDPREEAREIARRLLESAGGGGERFREAGIVPWTGGVGALLREACEEAGIPWYSPTPGVGRRDAATRGLLDLLKLLAGPGGRAELADFLGSAPLASPGPPEVDPFAFWIRAGAVEGMTGEDGWEIETRRLIEKYERSVRQGSADRRLPGALRECAGVIAVIERTRREISACTAWSRFAAVTGEAAAALFAPVEGIVPALGRLEELGGLDRISAGATLRRFAAVAAAVLAEDPGTRGASGAGGVGIITAQQSRGLRFSTVFLPGLVEGIVPGPVRQDPFLKDFERDAIERAAGEGVRLSRRSGRLEETRLIFALACRSATSRLFCSFPRIDGGTGREFLPSSYLLHPDLRPGGEAGLGRIRLPLGGRPEGSEVPLSRFDHDFIHAGRPRGRAVYIPGAPFFGRGARCMRERWSSPRFTPYDGVFESPAAVAALERLLGERGWSFSATSLESYARCPFAFYIGKILRIEQVEEPERAVTLTPLRRGSAVHLVLERVFRGLAADGLLPLSHPVRERALALSREVSGAVLDEFAAAEPVGRGVFWEVERRRIARAVERFVAEEADAGSDYLPVRFEQRFGDEGSPGPVAVRAGGRTISFHGRIDRIDSSPQERYRVVDYKTGSLRQRDQDLGGGENLQLPVYLLAASAILGLPVERGEAVYRRVGDGDGKRTVLFRGDGWETDGPRLSRILETIVDGVSGGIFFAIPGAGRCEYCGARQACPTGCGRLFERKSGADGRAGRYLAMREADDER